MANISENQQKVADARSVCSLHFLSTDFHQRKCRRIIKSTVVPSQNRPKTSIDKFKKRETTRERSRKNRWSNSTTVSVFITDDSMTVNKSRSIGMQEAEGEDDYQQDTIDTSNNTRSEISYYKNHTTMDSAHGYEKYASFSERLNEILEIKFGKRRETLKAFSELSTFLCENTLNSRCTLRSKVEKRGIVIIQDFLRNVENVNQSLDNIHENVSQMSNNINKSVNRFQETKCRTFHLRDHLTKLQSDNGRIKMQQLILSRFVEKFQLSKEETEILKQPDVTNEFFLALEKTRTIHDNCKYLLESGNQIAAQSIMEQMSFLQETAIEFLYRWVQIHCKDIESSKMASLLAKAMAQFQNRAILFFNLIEDYSKVRRAVIVRLFIDALTKGGSNGIPKPIETYAHDKKRYVSDMLAWLRQHVPSEKENLLLFLKDCNTMKDDIRKEIEKAMCNITEGLCSVLSVRIEFIIASSSSPFELYDTFNLLRYYTNIISEELPDSALKTTTNELTEVAECAFLNAIRNLVRQSVLEKIEPPSPDLMPTTGIGYLLNFMTEILSVAGLNEGRKEFVSKIVNCVLEPLLQAVNLSASRLTSVDMAVYMLNCIDEIVNALSIYEFTDDWLERLQAQAEAQLDTLTSEQASSLVNNLQLGLIYTILQDQSKIPLSKVPGMDSGRIESFTNKLESFLHAPDIMTLPQINCIHNSKFRNRILYRANEVIVAVYRRLYSAIQDPANQYQNPSSLLPHTVQEIEKYLLPVEDDENDL